MGLFQEEASKLEAEKEHGEETQEEEASVTPPQNTGKPRNRRGAVSAEVYSEKDITNYVKKVGL